MHYANTESYQKQGIHVHINSDVVDLDTSTKSITVNENGEETKVSYDKLFLSPGGKPVAPPVEGIDNTNHVYYMRGREWADAIKNRLNTTKKAIIVGGGYIGIEVQKRLLKQVLILK